ncbi:hypothetical protein IMSAG049_00578 [Clostridiales bacterium]|nr:hypothetical protein IMSAG049_00578 [Clostridiales bacterium]
MGTTPIKIHAFEDIEVKKNAPQLLERALRSKRKRCMIGTGAMCDSYMHCEEELELTRRCLEIIDQYGFGLAIQTKSDRILRDLDLLKSINKKAKCVVQMTLTTYDEELCRILEPNVEVFHRHAVKLLYGVDDLRKQDDHIPCIKNMPVGLSGDDSCPVGYINNFHLIVPVEGIGTNIFGNNAAVNGIGEGKFAVGFSLMHDWGSHLECLLCLD